MNAPGSPSSPLQITYFCGARLDTGQVPLLAGGKTGAAAAAQPGIEDLLADAFGRHVAEHLGQRLVAATGDVLFDALRVDAAAVGQHLAHLLAIEGRFSGWA